MIPQLVQNDTERIDIRPAVVFFSLIHLRSHVGKSPLLRQAGCAAVQFPCYPEISQLEFSESGNKNVLRLDVSVDDILLLTVFKGAAEIDPQPQHILLCQLSSLAKFKKTGEIFHPDIDIPSDIVQILHHFIIFHGHNMGIPPEIFHGADFLNTVVHKTVEVFPHRTVVMEFRAGAVQLALAGGYGNDLYRRVKSLALLCSSGLINLAERTFSDLLDNFPFRPYGNRQLHLHTILPPFPVRSCILRPVNSVSLRLFFRVLIIARQFPFVCIFRFFSSFFHTILRNFSQK